MHVIFGTGALGMAVMREMRRRGKNVRMVNRGSRPLLLPEGVELVHGDAKDASFCKEACRDAEVVFNCTGLPYSEWVSELPAIQQGIIEGASSTEVKLIYADNLYAYGSSQGMYHEELPNNPVGPKTKVRGHIADMVMQAHREGKLRAAIGRGPDFYGPGVTQAVLGERVFRAALSGKPAEALGNIDLPHTHIYIDDFAKGLVTLSEQERALGETWLLPAAETLTTRQLITMAFEAAGRKPAYRIASGFLLTAMGWFSPAMKEFHELRFMFEEPCRVNHGKFADVFGSHVTPHEVAIQLTLDWYRRHD